MCIDLIGTLHPLKTELDEEMFQHLIYALNSIILTVKDGKGLNKGTIVRGGKTLLRLSRVIQAYVHKKNKENIPAEELAKQLVKIVDSAHDIFVGGTVPKL